MDVVIRQFGNVRSVSEVGPAQDQQILFRTRLGDCAIIQGRRADSQGCCSPQ